MRGSLFHSTSDTYITYSTLREVVLVPNRHWGGEGLLGCVFGYTVFHSEAIIGFVNSNLSVATACSIGSPQFKKTLLMTTTYITMKVKRLSLQMKCTSNPGMNQKGSRSILRTTIEHELLHAIPSGILWVRRYRTAHNRIIWTLQYE